MFAEYEHIDIAKRESLRGMIGCGVHIHRARLAMRNRFVVIVCKNAEE